MPNILKLPSRHLFSSGFLAHLCSVFNVASTGTYRVNLAKRLFIFLTASPNLLISFFSLEVLLCTRCSPLYLINSAKSVLIGRSSRCTVHLVPDEPLATGGSQSSLGLFQLVDFKSLCILQSFESKLLSSHVVTVVILFSISPFQNTISEHFHFCFKAPALLTRLSNHRAFLNHAGWATSTSTGNIIPNSFKELLCRTPAFHQFT